MLTPVDSPWAQFEMSTLLQHFRFSDVHRGKVQLAAALVEAFARFL